MGRSQPGRARGVRPPDAAGVGATRHARLFEDFSAADWARARARANWRFEALPTGALPHFEMPDAFADKLRAILAAHG